MERENWSSSLGFFLSCVGCAIGLGNIWLFPWRLSHYGSISFLIPYILFTFGFVAFGLMSELALGRKFQGGTIKAFEGAFGSKRKHAARIFGGFQVVAQSGITVFYLVVMGWILRYLWLSITGDLLTIEPEGEFSGFSGHSCVIPWHMAAVFITGCVVYFGIEKGVEKANKWAISGMFLIFILLIINTFTIPGAVDGVKDFMHPKWGLLKSSELWIMALGQSFFTVSLGGMLIYGSYLKHESDIPKASYLIVSTNLLASLLAAFIIIPAGAAFGISPDKGPGLLFMNMPHVFQQMPGGHFFGFAFFLSVFLAGLSSAINLMEIPSEAFMHLFNISRRRATMSVVLLTLLLGSPLTVSMSRFGSFVDIVTIYLYPLGVLIIVFVTQWVWGSDKAYEAINEGSRFPISHRVKFLLKYIFLSICILVYVLNIYFGGIG
jgi:NSS family neurotransmitter:Na+ symporter